MNKRVYISNKNKGVALITAMLIVAITGIISSNLLWENILNTRKTMSTLNQDQAIEVALGAENWIKQILKQDAINSTTDHLNELWAKKLPNLPIDGGGISGEIIDLQSRFNINNIIQSDGTLNQNQFNQLHRLLKILNLDPNIANVIVDWIDKDQYPTYPGGAEDDIYTKMNPPYRTSNQKIITITELLSINSMTIESYKLLEPHISAIPISTQINVNTAGSTILSSLDDGVTQNDIQRLINERNPNGFTDIFTSFKPLLLPENLSNISDKSNYFQLKLLVNIDSITITMFTTIKREANGDTSVINRSFGTI
ncbi:MAG: type II secretion system minor pseudopilin GspK [Pseudomonadota bacterium]|nr:type II secretion system minor pseudopilin GspK [Pseudomonadota bacterium]